jgi:hypothetical protein
VTVPVKTATKMRPPKMRPSASRTVADMADMVGGGDPLSKLAKDTQGPSALGDVLSGGDEEKQQGASEESQNEGQTMTTAPQVGGGGADPLKWVLGAGAPSVSALRMMSFELEKEALSHYKRAPKTKDSKAFLDATRRFQGELGQFGALCSLAKMSGDWSGAGLHAASQLTEAMGLLAEMVGDVVERPSSDLPSRVKTQTDRLRAGRQVFHSGNAPFRRSQTGLLDPSTMFGLGG